MPERWKWVEGWEGMYMVSDQGRVMSAPRTTSGKTYAGMVLSPTNNGDGYLKVSLSRGGKRTLASVHRLVAKAFVPNPLGRDEVNHINGKKDDARADNLEWVTHSENVEHSWRELGRKAGNCFHPVKLTEEQARAVYEDTGTYAEIGRRHGISNVMARNIKTGKSWRFISCR